jgi:hypothetical protein
MTGLPPRRRKNSQLEACGKIATIHVGPIRIAAHTARQPAAAARPAGDAVCSCRLTVGGRTILGVDVGRLQSAGGADEGAGSERQARSRRSRRSLATAVTSTAVNAG